MRLTSRSTRPCIPAALVLASALNCAVARAQELLIHHIPQVGLTADGVPDDPMGERTLRWAAQAGFTVRWRAVPFRRSLEALRRNAEPFCVLGVFDVPARRAYARLSAPIARGEAQILLAARRVAPQMRMLPDVRAALLDPRFELVAFDGVAYGAELDLWIASRKREPVWVTSGTAQVMSLLARGRADFTISVPSDLPRLRAAAGAESADVQVLALPGMPEPPARHLACSLRVPPDWLTRLDAAVARTPPPAAAGQ